MMMERRIEVRAQHRARCLVIFQGTSTSKKGGWEGDDVQGERMRKRDRVS